MRDRHTLTFRGPFEPAIRTLLEGIQDIRGTSPVAASTRKSKGYMFISYADGDAEFVAELKLFLKKRGYAYWDFQESKRDYRTTKPTTLLSWRIS
jgi:hypothetical protein